MQRKLLIWVWIYHVLFIAYAKKADEGGNLYDREDVAFLRNQTFKWREIAKYYYKSVEQKAEVILHSGCESSYELLPDYSPIAVSSDRKVVNFIPYPPSQELYNWWKSIPPPVQMRVEPNLCESVYRKRRPIFNNTGCQLPHYMSASAPRCQTGYLKWICEHSTLPTNETKPNYFILPESNHKTWIDPPTPYLATIREAYVTMCGQILAACGVLHTNANCMSTGQRDMMKRFTKKCSLSSVDELIGKQKIQEGYNTSCPGAPFSDMIHHYDRVFVVAEVDDTYVYHVHLEIFPRIVQHLEFLRNNPDVKILIGCDTKDSKGQTAFGLSEGLKAIKLMMKLFEFPEDRYIVHQHVFAREIFLPMEGACQDPVYNTWQILSMRQKIMMMLQLPTGYRHYPTPAGGRHSLAVTTDDYKIPSGKKPVMLLLKRSSNSEFTRNKFDLVRQWSDEFAAKIVEALAKQFPQYEIKVYSDRDKKTMNCFECQVRLMAEADVLIGVHGAGLGMSLYMPPNKAIIEFAPYGNDGRCLLGGGPFSRLATVLSQNYMMHHPVYEEFKWVSGKSSEFDINRFVQHIDAFLKSIDFL